MNVVVVMDLGRIAEASHDLPDHHVLGGPVIRPLRDEPEILTLARQLIKLGNLRQIDRAIYRVAVEEFGKTAAVACQLGVTLQTVRNKKRLYRLGPDSRQSKIF